MSLSQTLGSFVSNAFGVSGEIRTLDHSIKSQVLYRLSYRYIYWLFIVLSPHFLVHDAKILVH